MENPGYIALSRQMVLRRQMDLLANNLANLTTPGYRGESMLFVEHLKPTQPREQVAFVQDLATVRDLRAGPMSHTGNPLDLAIKGEGYFAVETPEGERYTRAGGFTLDPDGQIVTVKGYPLLGKGGAPITVPPDSGAVTVARDGTVSSDQGEGLERPGRARPHPPGRLRQRAGARQARGRALRRQGPGAPIPRRTGHPAGQARSLQRGRHRRDDQADQRRAQLSGGGQHGQSGTPAPAPGDRRPGRRAQIENREQEGARP
jgi:flagellar basal-body rod protein FlgF